jgi:glycosyltransferase involved in cell wall biosynthesis
MKRTSLAVICDFAEENWPSMNLVAEMLLKKLDARYSQDVQAVLIRPSMAWRLSFLLPKTRMLTNADRLINRFWDYPRHLRSRLPHFDFFHVCDHSYAHLVHELPAERTGVYCHDLDSFRCLLEPRSEPRPLWFRAMSRRILEGMQKAAVVFCSTQVTKQRILQLGLIDPARLVYAPYGISPEFLSSPNHPASGASHYGRHDPFVLHVGSCIPRKRIDVLLDVFAKVRSRFPELQLLQVGGDWTRQQREQIRRLQISSAVHQYSGIDREILADLYRKARLVMQPSEAEGFGLPVIEALACGAIVVASDIPVLREVSGDAVLYCPVADISRWSAAIEKLLLDPAGAPDANSRLAQAHRYSWDLHTETILQAYLSKRRVAA